MFIALREETVGLGRSPMFSLAVDISLLRSEVVSITHPSYKHLTTPRSGPGQRSSTHYYPTTKSPHGFAQKVDLPGRYFSSAPKARQMVARGEARSVAECVTPGPVKQ